MDRLGVAQALVDKGMTWKTGKVFFDTRQVYEFDLLPEAGTAAGLHQPAAILLRALLHRGRMRERPDRPALAGGGDGHRHTSDGVLLDIATPDGSYRVTADWVIAADGARSTLRRLLGLGFEGRVFQDQFLICDIKMRMRAAGRALVLVRPTLQPRAVGATASAGRRRLAPRFPGRRRGRPRRGDEARECSQSRAGACWARTSTSPSNGSASTASSRGGCRNSATVA